jgi:hypothetical protein
MKSPLCSISSILNKKGGGGQVWRSRGKEAWRYEPVVVSLELSFISIDQLDTSSPSKTILSLFHNSTRFDKELVPSIGFHIADFIKICLVVTFQNPILIRNHPFQGTKLDTFRTLRKRSVRRIGEREPTSAERAAKRPLGSK